MSAAGSEFLAVPKRDGNGNDWPLSSGSSPNASSPPSPSAAVRVLPRGPEVAPDSTPKHAVTPEPVPRKVLRNSVMLLKFGLIIGGFLVLNCYQLAALLLLRPFSVKAYRAAQTALCGSWVNVLLLWLDRLAGNRFFVSGDGDFWSQRATYNAVVMCNHISYGDWPVMFMCAFRAGVAGWLRVVLKRVGAYMPGLGWACAFHEFLFLRRAWDQDAGPMTTRIASFVANRTPLWIMIFPEGTFTDNTSPQIVHDAHAFADKANIPRRHHTLLPRVKGFSVLRNAGPDDYISRVVDLTLVFTGQTDPKHCHPFGSDKPLLDKGRLLPDVLSFLNGQSPDVHVHARVYDVADLPRAESDLKKWLFDTFAAKEKLIAAFHETGTFPSGEQQHTLPLMPLVLHQIGWLFAAYGVYVCGGALLPVWLFKGLLYAFASILVAATGVQALMR